MAVGALGVLGAQAALARRSRAASAARSTSWAAPPRAGSGRARRRLFLGIDIGGTNVNVGVVDDNGVLQGGGASVQSAQLGDEHAPAAVVARLAAMALAALGAVGCSLDEVSGIGVCTPGLLDCQRGVVNSAANLRGWWSVPLTQLLAEELGVDVSIVVLENDANTALLAEVWSGIARGRQNVVLLTLGTGIGCAILCDGRLLRGSRGEAGEVGHTILIPDGRPFGGAGVLGIFEAYASASAVGQIAREAGVPANSPLASLAEVSCQDVFHHAAQGDTYAAQVVHDTARYLAIGCINCTRCYDPDMIIFAGGMSLAGKQLLEAVRAQYARYHWNLKPVSVEFCVAAAGNYAGVIGAAYAARSVILGA